MGGGREDGQKGWGESAKRGKKGQGSENGLWVGEGANGRRATSRGASAEAAAATPWRRAGGGGHAGGGSAAVWPASFCGLYGTMSRVIRERGYAVAWLGFCGRQRFAGRGADACHMPDILGACGYASDRFRVPPDARSYTCRMTCTGQL